MKERIKKLMTESGIDPNATEVALTPGQINDYSVTLVRDILSIVKDNYSELSDDIDLLKDKHWSGYHQCGIDTLVEIKIQYQLDDFS